MRMAFRRCSNHGGLRGQAANKNQKNQYQHRQNQLQYHKNQYHHKNQYDHKKQHHKKTQYKHGLRRGSQQASP